MDSKLDFREKSNVITVKSQTEMDFRQTYRTKLVCEVRRNDKVLISRFSLLRLVFTSDGVAVEVVIRSVELYDLAKTAF